MDLDAVRTFTAIADTGQFQTAADDLGITQQAVSKRVATLERSLGVRLFTRTPRGAALTVDGQAFLPHAHELLRTAERAKAAVTPGTRPLRVDVISRRIAPATLLREFHRQNPNTPLDVVALINHDTGAALAEVAAGTIDATFRSLRHTPHLPPSLEAAHVIDDPHHLLVGPRHPLAKATSVTPRDLAGHPIWMPGMVDPEPVAYYADLADAFDLTIDTIGPSFGYEALLTELAESATLATFIGEGTHYLWPESYNLSRIPIVNPTPVYPLSIVWRRNPHATLPTLLDYLHTRHNAHPTPNPWPASRAI